MARRLIGYIESTWTALGHPCTERAVEHALTGAARRAEAECDLGVLMREDPVELRHDDPWARARWLARRFGLDATAIWEWGAAERVSTGLLCTMIGLQPVGREMLATADYIAALPPAPA